MKVAVVFLCLVVAALAKPQFGRFGFGGATGQAGAGSTQGQTSGIFGTSQLQQSNAFAGGSAGPGGASFNQASSNAAQGTGFFGSFQNANNQATSNQFGK